MVSPLRVSASMFDSLYLRQERENILRRIDTEIDGTNEAALLGCNGFLANGDLSRFRDTLARCFPTSNHDRHEKLLLDLGCGIGGLGIWLATEFKCRLVGIDFSSVAISRAQSTLPKELRAERRRFKVADFTASGLNDESVTAAISLDALYLASDPVAALVEAGRVLMPGGLLLFTAYVKLSQQEYPGTSELKLDWRPLLKSTGFAIERYEDVSFLWRRQMRHRHQHRWKERKRIRAELGPQADAELAVSAAMLGFGGRPSFLDHTARFEVVARRVSSPSKGHSRQV